jgi:hypothetical protein
MPLEEGPAEASMSSKPNTPGAPLVDPSVSVREICDIADLHAGYWYSEAAAGNAPVPHRGRVSLRVASAWLDKRAEKYTKRAEAAAKVRELLAEALAREGAQ